MAKEQKPSNGTQREDEVKPPDRQEASGLGHDLLSEFVQVVHNVIPVLDQMKNSITESSRKIPKASLQLNSVTRATETATVEILNVLDSMTRKIAQFEAILVKIAERESQMEAVGMAISSRLHTLSIQTPSGDGVAELHKLWSDYLEMTSHSDLPAFASRALSEVRSETLSIAMSLQVQDITAQQIAGVIHLIESVRTQLTKVLVKLEDTGNTLANADDQIGEDSQQTGNQAFDVNAQFTHNPERQDIADDIINAWSNTTRRVE
ncbi:MAG TPA: hypothetical protein DGH68_02170 [Bacteroidetes bacterium]|jgi:chemotaxis regulatin CheY-phosphate phosphatase CheZ|nr:hypothetical protein [Bacteroidota bacterium]